MPETRTNQISRAREILPGTDSKRGGRHARPFRPAAALRILPAGGSGSWGAEHAAGETERERRGNDRRRGLGASRHAKRDRGGDDCRHRTLTARTFVALRRALAVVSVTWTQLGAVAERRHRLHYFCDPRQSCQDAGQEQGDQNESYEIHRVIMVQTVIGGNRPGSGRDRPP